MPIQGDVGGFKRVDRQARDERGQAMVEFAMVLPVLMLILVAILQFGLMFWNYIDLTASTRDGARKAAVSRYAPNPVADTENQVEYSTTVVDDANNEIRVSTPAGWTAGEAVIVRSEYPYQLSILGITLWDGPMVAESRVRIE